MKVLAMYLPQFHRVKENDEWWGEGFTEWTAVKQAESYFKGQVQPRVPLDNNYYNLLEKDTMLWQSKLMQEYGIHGMVFYHYWFKDGRQILEKPAENLLQWKDVDMSFCFSWANETWARSWSNISDKNSWSTKNESQTVDNTDGVLLQQGYGNEDDWKKHLLYLVQFFRDARYIKIDNKPVFIIYKPIVISCIVKMIEYWRAEIKKFGFEDLYIIGVNCYMEGVLDATLLQEPQGTIRSFKNEQTISAAKIWDTILNRKVDTGIKTYLCGFSGYDDTPRRGEGGKAVSLLSGEDFGYYYKRLLKKSHDLGNEYIFFNAWNEWGEGMYLEPDKLNQYAYLDAMKKAMMEFEKMEERDLSNHDINESNQLVSRYYSYWQIYDKWLTILECGKSITEYFQTHDVRKIAIYGIGMLGQHILEQLENSNVQVVYGIDIRGTDIKKKFPIYKAYQHDQEIDMVVVSVTYDYYKIKKELQKCAECRVISIDEIIGELLE